MAGAISVYVKFAVPAAGRAAVPSASHLGECEQ